MTEIIASAHDGGILLLFSVLLNELGSRGIS